jgi:hypothetical protein
MAASWARPTLAMPSTEARAASGLLSQYSKTGVPKRCSKAVSPVRRLCAIALKDRQVQRSPIISA